MLDLTNRTTPYLIGEIGINHNGEINIAKRLLDACFATGWDCAKFQKRSPDDAVPKGEREKRRDTPWGEMSYIEYKHKIEFGKTEYDLINEYCATKPLDWTMSVWDQPSLEFASRYNLPFLKLPSAKLTDDELLIDSCRTGQLIVVSTGMSTVEEIDHAVEILEKHAVSFVLLHSTSTYPTKNHEINLNSIPYLQERYGCMVGYSGHEYGLTPTVVAGAMGAAIIERHITLDHTMWGTDQSASIEITGMDVIRKRFNADMNIFGEKTKFLFESEKAARKKLRAR
jgi:N-acetylneuraminate synthase